MILTPRRWERIFHKHKVVQLYNFMFTDIVREEDTLGRV